MTQSDTFLEQCLDGNVSSDDIDAFVDAWHEGDGDGETLGRYLGFGDSEYALWVERPEMLEAILEERRSGRPVPRTD
jgi:hypothetical protein